MESKIVGMTLLIAILASPAMLSAQQSALPPPSAGINAVAKPDVFVVPKTDVTKITGWKDQRSSIEGRDRFAKMFEAKAAEAGDPRRIPFYLLTPFARGGGQSAMAGTDTFLKSPMNRPSLAKDVGALIGSLRTNN